MVQQNTLLEYFYRTIEWRELKETWRSSHSNPLPWPGTTSTRPGCAGPHPIWPWTLPGKRHLQLLLETLQCLTTITIKNFFLIFHLNLTPVFHRSYWYWELPQLRCRRLHLALFAVPLLKRIKVPSGWHPSLKPIWDTIPALNHNKVDIF